MVYTSLYHRRRAGQCLSSGDGRLSITERQGNSLQVLIQEAEHGLVAALLVGLLPEAVTSIIEDDDSTGTPFFFTAATISVAHLDVERLAEALPVGRYALQRADPVGHAEQVDADVEFIRRQRGARRPSSVQS